MANNPFIPKKLPVKISYENLVTDIARSHKAIARLDATLSQLPNPKLLQRTFLTKEAVLSSQIEGTQATIREVFEQEARGKDKIDSEKKRDIQEILNYRRAVNKGVELLKQRPISENLIKELHKTLLQSVRGHNKAPGEFRRVQVYVGKPGASIKNASFVPPPPNLIPELFSNLEKYLNNQQDKDELTQIAIAHYQFEAIHPFLDGNGRIGRLLISLFLFDRKLLSHPFLYISEFFEEHRQDYYALLKKVSAQDDWESWIKFFLKALSIQAEKAQQTTQEILTLYQGYKEQMDELNSIYAINLLDTIFAYPVFSYKIIKTKAGIKNHQTLINLIKKFIKAGIIKDSTPKKKRDKVYIFNNLMKVLLK